MEPLKITVTGSGTSMGVPIVGRDSPVNLSTDPRDQRKRSSLLIQTQKTNLVIDTGPDFRMQMLENRVPYLNAILFTHHHYDHIGGLDDVRPYTTLTNAHIDVYCNQATYIEIKKRYHYLYDEGGPYAPPNMNFINMAIDNEEYSKFTIETVDIQPIDMIHVESPLLHSTGYIINNKIAYLTDFKIIPEKHHHLLYNLDIMIVGAPLPFPHNNHVSIKQAVELIQKFKPESAYITHLSDKKFHHELERELPSNISPAYDGLVLKI